MRKILLVLLVLILVIGGYFLGGITGEVVKTPQNHLEDENILVFEDRVVMYINNSTLSRYGGTGSMIPVLSENAKGIKVKPKSPDDVKVGDIVTFEKNKELVVHRVIEKGADGEGVYFITKGDNNQENDGKIRFEEIRGVLVAVIY